jgi:RecA/RadA recombinase
MNLRERKAKYEKQKQPEGIKFNFDLTMMNTFCSYVLSENTNVHRNSLVSLRTVLSKIQESMFENNQECIIRFRFCKAVLDTKLVKKLIKRDLVLRDVYGVVGNNFENLDPNNFNELCNEDIKWVEDTIVSCMDTVFINNEILELRNVCDEYINANYINKMNYANRVKEKVGFMQTQFRRNDIDRDADNQVFRLSNSESSINDLYVRMNRPSYKLMTGMQGVNDILGGGFEGSRVYCFFGLPGEGKTVTLLNLLYQIKKYNKEYECRDKTKRPCLVLLTMENQVYESICTLFNIACSSEDINNYTPEEALQLMMAKELAVTMDSPIDIIVKYKPINSVDTNYLYKLTEDLEDEGYEVIGLIQDYIKRIKPLDDNKEPRFILGNVINDFKNFAIYKDIPVISASQLNREAARIVDDGRDSKKNDLVRKLGRANIGESSLIDENLDGSIFLTPEWVGDDKYMGIKLTKHRYKIYTHTTSIYQPFEEGNEVKLAEDEGMNKPLFKESLAKDNEAIKKAFGDTMRFSTNREIKDIDELERDESRLITGGTVYSEEPKAAAYHPIPKPEFVRIAYRDPNFKPGKVCIAYREKIS